MTKNPLHYQVSEYDCGPTAVLNAMSYLFFREALSPDLIRNIMLYCLDCFGSDGSTGKRGTSCMAMMFLSNWINGYGQVGYLPVSSEFLSQKEVSFGEHSKIEDALRRRGAVVVRVDFDGWHYVLLTGIKKDKIYLFDPYYRKEPFSYEDIIMTEEYPTDYNRIVPIHYFEKEELGIYSLGPIETREAVIFFNEETKLTWENTVEYVI